MGELQWVYPRVGGATDVGLLSGVAVLGLSPRGRGNLDVGEDGITENRSIPAWAGQPPSFALQERLDQVYPRVGGATPLEVESCLCRVGLSPRGRGNPHFENIGGG